MKNAHTHTPGPWKYSRGNGSPTTGQHMIAGSKPGYLAEVRDCGSGDVIANGRLIAAAPELLEALYSALNIEGAAMEGGRAKAYNGLDIQWHFDKIRAAIKKATA